jgi:hypothetical protein
VGNKKKDNILVQWIILEHRQRDMLFRGGGGDTFELYDYLYV